MAECHTTSPTRQCRKCKEHKPYSELTYIRGKPQTICRKCTNRYSADQHKKQPPIVYDNLDEPRLCSLCENVKPLRDFKVTRGRRFRRCKCCTELVNREWQAKHPQEAAAIKARYVVKHPDRNRESKQKYARNTVAQRAEWKRAHRAEVNSAAKRAYEKDPTKQVDRQKRYSARYPERVRKQRVRAAADHRARLCNAEGRYTQSDVDRMYASQNGRCAEPTCKVKLADRYHVDHIMPLALGGSNWPDNLQLLCPPCNCRKHKLHPYEWARRNGRLF